MAVRRAWIFMFSSPPRTARARPWSALAQVDGSPGQVTGADVAAAAEEAARIARGKDGFYVDQINAAEGILAHLSRKSPQGAVSRFAESAGQWRQNSSYAFTNSQSVLSVVAPP